MQKRTLIFDDSVEGHHLEYIHHLYVGASAIKDEEFIFVLDPAFKNVKKKLIWNSYPSIAIEYISKKDIEKLKKSKFVKSYFLCKLLKKTANKYNTTNIFLISLMPFLPFMPFFFDKKTKISGIIYKIYLYEWYNSNLQSRIGNLIKYMILSKSKIFNNIFLLNDNIAPLYLNRKFKTSVFSYLPDPFMPIPKVELKNLRAELNISEKKKVCLHFGALTERKGTIEILKAIIDSKEFVMKNYCFIFAGKIFDDIKESFYTLVKDAELKTQIIIYDKFCDYNFIGSLCLSSDFLLIPYKVSAQSSGVLGYGNQFRIPIVGPSIGLIGKLIKRYKMGVLLDDASSDGLKIFFENIENTNLNIGTDYIEHRKVSAFRDAILNINYKK